MVNEYIKYILLLILCSCSAWCYHIGGTGKDGATKYPKLPKWLWGKINSKIRDWGCSLCAIFALCILRGGFPIDSGQTIWITAFSLLGWFLLSWGALSTYWKKSGDCKWYHWLAHGLGVGLSALPLVFIGIPWWLILIRAVVLGLTMMAVSEYFENVTAEECSRGVLVVATLVLLK